LSPIFLFNAAAEGRIFALDSQMFISVGIQLFNTVLLAFVLTKILYKPVRRILARRAQTVRDRLVQTESDRAEASALKSNYAHKMAEVENERREILAAAHKQAAIDKHSIISEAKNEAEAIRARTAQDTQREWARAEEAMRLHIMEVSSVLAQKIMRVSVDEETHNRLFEETLKELDEAPWPS
jgi:F-type H+-transporting ATPase subunit b